MINSLYEPFINWSMTGSVYVYSDPHFDDEDCLCMNPNWPSPEEQIKRINQKVHKNDTLIILGDVGNEKYIKQLKAGHKVLILGNHDKGQTNYTFDNLFDEVYGGPLFIGEKILLSHEPISLPFAINIHGHCHNGVFKETEKDYNVASDVINWTPVNLGKMIKEEMLSGVDSIHRLTLPQLKQWDSCFNDRYLHTFYTCPKELSPQALIILFLCVPQYSLIFKLRLSLC